MKRIMKRILLLSISLLVATGTMTYAGQSAEAEANAASAGNKVTAGTAVQVEKNETVYATLDHYGNVTGKRVVNRLNTSSIANGTGAAVLDYGKYTSVRNMESDNQPGIDGDALTWAAGLAEKGDIYYEGVTDKELPLAISLSYFLDGKEIDPLDITGRSGTLKIVIQMENKLKDADLYVPLLVQITYAADLEIFREIKAEDAVRVVAGKTMNLGFSAFPYPDAEISFEMTGRNMELNAFNITVVPQMLPLPALDMEGQMRELLDGVKKIRDGVDEYRSAENTGPLFTGWDKSLQGFNQLTNGFENLSEGLSMAASGVEELSGAAKQVSGSIGALKQGAGQASEASTALADGLAQLKQMNGGLAAQAQQLVAQNPAGSDLYNLGMAILAQNEAVNALADGGKELDTGVKSLHNGLDALKEGMDTQFLSGVEQLNQSAAQASSGTKSLLEGMKIYEKNQNTLKTGFKKYVDSAAGISDGIARLEEELAKALDDIRSGTVQTDRMKALAEGYRSFMDNEKNTVSHVQFIMRTPEVKAADQPVASAPAQPGKKESFWKKLLGLFGM